MTSFCILSLAFCVFNCAALLQWRKSLKLSGERTVDKITLDGVKGLRVALGATAHDILYYMSPIYCQHIIDSVFFFINSVSLPLFQIYCLCLMLLDVFLGLPSLFGGIRFLMV
jgi:hypothetical protein